MGENRKPKLNSMDMISVGQFLLYLSKKKNAKYGHLIHTDICINISDFWYYFH